MADWYAVAGATSGDGSQGAPWGTITEINAAWGSMGATDTLWLSGEFNAATDAILTVSIDGTDEDNRFTIRGDLAETQAIINGNNDVVRCISLVNDDYIHLKNITVKNGWITSDAITAMGLLVDKCTGVLVENVTAESCNWDGIKITGCTDTTVLNCTATGNLRRGIGISGVAAATDNVWIRNCTATGNGRRGFTLSGASGGQNATNCGITGCTSRGNGGGYQLGNSVNSEITNNTSANETLDTLDPTGSEKFWNVEVISSLGGHVTGNTLTGSSKDASCIYIEGTATETSENLTIQGNLMENMTGNAYAIQTIDLYAGNISVCGNAIVDCTRGYRAINNTVQRIYNNVFIGTDESIRCQTAVNNTNLWIRSNIFSKATTTNGFIYCVTAAGNVFEGGVNNNCYHTTAGQTLSYYNDVARDTTTNVSLDPAQIIEDPQFVDEAGGDYTPQNANLIGTGIETTFVAISVFPWYLQAPGIDINGEPFPSIDCDIGCVQGTDATNHPFHPLNL